MHLPDCPTFVPPVNGPNNFGRGGDKTFSRSEENERRESDRGWDNPRRRRSPEYGERDGGYKERHSGYRRRRSRERSWDRAQVPREEKRQRRD